MTGMWENGEYKTGDDVRDTDKSRETLDKQYVADAAYTVVHAGDETKLLGALKAPQWPAYVGRKSCGAGYLRPKKIDYPDVQTALKNLPLYDAADARDACRAWTEGRGRAVAGLRDWETRIHAGEQWIEESAVSLT